MASEQTLNEIKEMFGLVPEWMQKMPESAQDGFWAVARDFWLGKTTLPNKEKELIGIAVSGVTRCRYCALFHTEAARLFGATEEEIADAGMMGGVTMATSSFINSEQIDYKNFKNETLAIMEHIKRNAS